MNEWKKQEAAAALHCIRKRQKKRQWCASSGPLSLLSAHSDGCSDAIIAASAALFTAAAALFDGVRTGAGFSLGKCE